VALEYELRIFNRWGEVLFLTSNPQESWDGTYKGSPVQEGYYFYMLKGVGLDGEAFHSSGRIQLMR
jgi:gliding motility-associated-like protein